MSKILLISQEQVKSNLNMKKAMEIVERVYIAHANDSVNMPSKITLDLGESNDWPPYGGSYNAMPAYVGGEFDMAGMKWVWGFKDNPKKNLPYIGATILLNDPRTGEQLAIMDGSYITDIRTGATAGVAAKYLANQNSKKVAIIGAGVVGRQSLMAVCENFDVKKVMVSDIWLESAEKFIGEISKRINAEMIPTTCNQEAVSSADIIITATIANDALVKKEWLNRGALIISLGSFQELDQNIPMSADKLVVDNWEQSAHRGELLKLIEKGLITRKDIHSEMPDIIIGKNAPRETESEIICVCLIGMGSTDIGIATKVYQEVKDTIDQVFLIRE